MFSPYPKKLNHKRRVSKNRKQFTVPIIKQICQRDRYNCIRCGSYHIEETPHHIIFKSQGGLGDIENGATVCRACHTWAHSCKEGREWFENWQKTKYPTYRDNNY
jgi:hypothetical protein